MAIIFTFYNHKGGVSKTTTTFNIASLIAQSKKKVLLIDGDPQCNLTEICLTKTIERLDEEMLATGNDNELPGSSLLEILKPRIDGSISSINVEDISLVKLSNYLSLLRGDVALSSIEDSLSEAHQQRFSSKIHEKRTYVAIGDFVNRLASFHQFEYVIFDVGPSSGALTRSIFLTCDAFYIPISPDRFNIQAIKTLSKIIDRWMSEHDQIIKDFNDLGLPVRHGKPQFLGAIPQFYKTYKGKPKPGYQLWIKRLPAAITNYLFPVLHKYSKNKDLASSLNVENICTPTIPDFQGLGPLMQEFGVPVFDIQREMTSIVTESGAPWGGGTWKGAVNRMKDFRSRYDQIVDRLKLIK